MNRTRFLVCSALALLSLCRAPTLGAQVSVDAVAGVGAGLGGPGKNGRDLFAVSATVALGIHDAPRGQWLIAVSGGGTGSLDDVACGIRLPDDGPFDCLDFPSTVAVGALVGWSSSRDIGRGFRLLGGPGFVNKSNDTRSNGIGFMAQMDGAAPIARHLSLVGGARGLLAPRWHGQHIIGTVTLHAGLRLQL